PHIQQIPEAAQQKAGSNHQHQRKRKLRYDEQSSRARLLAGACRAARRFFERMSQINSPSIEGRSETKNRAHDEGGEESEKQDDPVNGHFIEPRQAVWHEMQQKRLRAEENR